MTTNQIENAWIMFKQVDNLSHISYNESIPQTQHYGVLNIQLPKIEITEEPIIIHFMVDESGSMVEPSTEFKMSQTKMELVQQTIINMLNYIAENTKNVYVQVSGFDHKIRTYINPTKITKDNIDENINIIKTMKPMHLTDIGLALDTLNQKMNNQEQEINLPNNRRVGIFLTDGYASTGVTVPKILSTKVCLDKSINFIALGDSHDANLMNTLGDTNEITSNWFISNVEHIGNVYGEILFNELYRVLESVLLTVDNGKIYDYKTNTMVDQLKIGNLSSETNKNYHIISENIDECIVKISGIDANTNAIYNIEASDLPPLIPGNATKSEYNNPNYIDIHYLRLCVQQIMADARLNQESYIEQSMNPLNLKRQYNGQITRQYNGQYDMDYDDKYDDNNIFNNILPLEPQLPLPLSLPLRLPLPSGQIKLNKLIQDIDQYILDNKLDNNLILIGLKDDLTVIKHTIGTCNYLKHGFARECSQGSQTTCNTINEIPELFNINEPTPLSRNTTSAYATPGKTEIMRIISNQ